MILTFSFLFFVFFFNWFGLCVFVFEIKLLNLSEEIDEMPFSVPFFFLVVMLMLVRLVFFISMNIVAILLCRMTSGVGIQKILVKVSSMDRLGYWNECKRLNRVIWYLTMKKMNEIKWSPRLEIISKGQ